MLAARFLVETRSVHMAKKFPTSLPGTPRPEAAQTLLALLHAQGEVARLSEREQLFSSLLDSVNAVLWAFDWEARQVLYVSPAYERIFGRPASLVLADYNEWRDSIYPDDLEYAERSLAQVLLKGSVEDREYRILNAEGQVRWLSDKCYINQQREGEQRVIVVGIAEDITEKKQLEGELHRLATTDVLTQSSNRRHFFECAQQAFENAREDCTPLAFLLLDIDDFKQVNDSYGHQEGDQVLQRIADSGKAVLRRGDQFGRIGGEEFAAGGRADCRAFATRDPTAELQPWRSRIWRDREPGADGVERRGRVPGQPVRPRRCGDVPGQTPGEEPDRTGVVR